MRRISQLCKLTATVSVISVVCLACTQDGNHWAMHKPQQTQQDKTDSPTATSQEPALPKAEPTTTEPHPNPDPGSERDTRQTADESAQAVARFVSRLQSKSAATDTAASEELSAEQMTSGSASIMAMGVPEPLPESASGPFSKKPPQATEAPRVEAISIVTQADKPEEQQTETRALTTNESLDAAAVREEFSIRKYLSMLEDALRKDSANVDLQWQLSMLRMALGQDEKATSISDGIERERAELLCDAVVLSAEVRELLMDPSHPADETLAALELLRGKLQARAELSIPIVALCTRVQRFGIYDEMPPDQFVAHRRNSAALYTEIKNFVSRKLPDGQYETLLAGRLELLTDDGRLVWHHEEDSIKDISKQQREDFFVGWRVVFPPDLGPGDYVLKVILQDLLGGKANEAHVKISVEPQQLTSTSG
ncbi:MAG: hypothetical protein KAV82_10675 [Phycisphaerae bacterium]|nr:hypothetical protein [Phycisphaerae bacterium]